MLFHKRIYAYDRMLTAEYFLDCSIWVRDLFCSSTYPQCLGQDQAQGSHALTICWLNQYKKYKKWMTESGSNSVKRNTHTHTHTERRIWKDIHQKVISSFSGRVGFFVFLSYPFFLFTVTKAKTKEKKIIWGKEGVSFYKLSSCSPVNSLSFSCQNNIKLTSVLHVTWSTNLQYRSVPSGSHQTGPLGFNLIISLGSMQGPQDPITLDRASS